MNSRFFFPSKAFKKAPPQGMAAPDVIHFRRSSVVKPRPSTSKNFEVKPSQSPPKTAVSQTQKGSPSEDFVTIKLGSKQPGTQKLEEGSVKFQKASKEVAEEVGLAPPVPIFFMAERKPLIRLYLSDSLLKDWPALVTIAGFRRKFKARIMKHWTHEITHVVARLSRFPDYQVLHALGLGRKIVNKQWLWSSLQKGAIMPEEKFMPYKKQAARLHALPMPLLHGCCVIVLKANRKVRKTVRTVLKAFGAAIWTKKGHDACCKQHFIILDSPEDMFTRFLMFRMGICVKNVASAHLVTFQYMATSILEAQMAPHAARFGYVSGLPHLLTVLKANNVLVPSIPRGLAVVPEMDDE